MSRGPMHGRRGGFSVEVVDEMIALYDGDPKMTYGKLAARFGTSSQSIGNYLTGRTQRQRGRPRALRARTPVVVTNAIFRPRSDAIAKRQAARHALDEHPDVLRYRREKELSLQRNEDRRAAYQKLLADAHERINSDERGRRMVQRRRQRNGLRQRKARARSAA